MDDLRPRQTLSLIGGVLMLLAAATAVVQVLQRPPDSGINAAILETFRLPRPRLVDPVRRSWPPRFFIGQTRPRWCCSG